jgi:hypothetical protein
MYLAASYAVAGIPCRLALVVVGLGVDHEGRAATLGKAIGAFARVYAFVFHVEVRFSVSAHGEITHVAQVVAVGIVEAVFLVGGVEVATRALEVRAGAYGFLVEVHGVIAGAEAFYFEVYVHPFFKIGDRRFAHFFPGSVFEFNFERMARSGFSERGSRKKGQRHDKKFHGILLVCSKGIHARGANAIKCGDSG